MSSHKIVIDGEVFRVRTTKWFDEWEAECWDHSITTKGVTERQALRKMIVALQCKILEDEDDFMGLHVRFDTHMTRIAQAADRLMWAIFSD